jgi:hypothetical protein
MKRRWIAKTLFIVDWLCVFAIFVWPANIFLILIEAIDGKESDIILLTCTCVVYLLWRAIFITCDSCLFQVLRIGINKKITILDSGWRYSNKDGTKDRRYTKKNRFKVDFEAEYPCYNCNKNITRKNPFGVLPESKEELEISNTFSYKYNGIVKKGFVLVTVVLIVAPVIVNALESLSHEAPYIEPSEEITGAEAAAKEDKTDQLRFNDIPDNNDARIKDTIVETKKSLYKINDPDGWTNMRESPNGKIIRTIDTLERFEIIGNNKNWMLIQLENKQKGFVHNSRIVIVD